MPMIDVFVEMPGASPAEVEQRVTRPMEKLLWEVPGVEYIYSTSSPGSRWSSSASWSARTRSERSCVSTRSSQANADRMPPGRRRRSSSPARSTTSRLPR